MSLPARAEQVGRERLLSLADAGAGEVHRGPGWTAVRTGVPSNDKNGVVSTGAVEPATVDRLLAWFARTPACWLFESPDPEVLARLVDAGGHPERTGHWTGSAVHSGTPIDQEPDPAGWLDVAEGCGWFTASERRSWFGLVSALTTPAYGRWVVRREGRAVGMAAAYAGSCLEVTDVAVLPAYRRQGIGTDLVGAATAWGATLGLTDVVAAPSPEGAALFTSLGWTFADVTPDTCVYLPTA